MNQAFLISTGAVALAEIGDKTQLLSLVLAARYRKPMPIILGVLAATLINHAGAGALGAWLGSLVTPTVMRWALAASFIGMGLWILVPDKLDDAEANTSRTHFGVFGATVVTFFLAEMGDKTQIATVALAARFHDFFLRFYFQLVAHSYICPVAESIDLAFACGYVGGEECLGRLFDGFIGRPP